PEDEVKEILENKFEVAGQSSNDDADTMTPGQSDKVK
ncbi:MAG: hypothetical protein ACI9OI_001695, partial [Chitinophagales bacterium]